MDNKIIDGMKKRIEKGKKCHDFMLSFCCINAFGALFKR